MRGDPLPEQDHVSRYCRPTSLGEDGQPNGTALMPRGDECLSVNWLEYFDLPDQEAQIAQVRQVIGIGVAAKGKFAVLNVGEVIDYVRENDPDNRVLDILHEPEENDPSHSGICGYSHDDYLVGDLIAEIVRGTYPARGSDQ